MCDTTTAILEGSQPEIERTTDRNRDRDWREKDEDFLDWIEIHLAVWVLFIPLWSSRFLGFSCEWDKKTKKKDVVGYWTVFRNNNNTTRCAVDSDTGVGFLCSRSERKQELEDSVCSPSAVVILMLPVQGTSVSLLFNDGNKFGSRTESVLPFSLSNLNMLLDSFRDLSE